MEHFSVICLFSVSLYGQRLQRGQNVPHIYGVVVGVNGATEESGEKLKYSEHDAREFATYLESPGAGSVSAFNIQLLVGNDATRANILRAIENISRKATPEDLIIFYFSGHGITDGATESGYLVPIDFQKDNTAV